MAETCVPWDLDSACCDSWDALDPTLQERATDLAWDTMKVLTGGRVGSCPVVMRPCLTGPCDCCIGWWGQGWMNPVLIAGEWVNCACGRPECSCERLCEIAFPGPVAVINEITVSGAVLAPHSYRVDNGSILVREDGECWPSCQNMGAPPGDPGTVVITYTPGIVPNGSGLWAAGVLACEFAKACSGGKCRLPAAVTSIARQGVNFQMQSAMFVDGMTGIREVDAYTMSVNPYHHLTPPMVWSPDMPSQRHRYETFRSQPTPP
ncbi:MAG: hypothetical protein EHM24_00070 [Acidobacteria bacterium]|nr:MAG: hypothetical protein EHM24_00070 [Acidobacteriota bacterium]